MEVLLLLLLGGLAAGVGLWATMGDRKGERPPGEGGTGPGPRSSPGLPEGGAGAESEEAGKPVVLGTKEDIDRLRETLKRAPDQMPGRTVPAERDDSGRVRPTRPSDRPLKVTYSSDELIARASRFAHHRRALSNADTLVERQKAEEALEVYERVKKRVPDEEIKGRIDQNIDDIKRWMAGADRDEEALQFPEIVIPLTTQAIALENLTEGLKNISQGIAQQLQVAFQAGAIPGGPVPPTGLMPPAAPGQAPPTGEGPAAAPPAPGAPPGPPGPIQYVAVPQDFRTMPAMGEIVSLTMGDQAKLEQGGMDRPGLPPGFELDENGRLITDGWTDEDFDREWEKYKNLPLKDRRSGIERRQKIDRRRSSDPNRRDRRSGDDRRKKDLFKERDEFLKKLRKHKERKRQLEDFLKKKKAAEVPKEPMLRIPLEAEVPPEPEPEKPPEPEPEKPPEPEKKPEPEREKEPEPEEEKEKEPSRMEILPPELKPVGMPSAEEPWIEPPQPVQAEATSAPGEGGAPAPSDFAEGEGEGVEAADEIPDLSESIDEEKKPPPQEIQGVLELRPPEEDDAPYLTLTYDFSKIPDSFKLSQDYHTMEYVYYKYKPMLVKAQEFTRRKMLKNALNYYRVIKSQNIPPEFRRMINRNIKDITEYLEKFLMRRN